MRIITFCYRIYAKGVRNTVTVSYALDFCGKAKLSAGFLVVKKIIICYIILVIL